TGREFLSLTIDGAWLGDVGVAEITDDRVLVDGRLPTRRGAKCLELRGKDDPLRRRRVVEWFDAEPVSRQNQAAGLSIPQRESEHANRTFDRSLDAPQCTSFEQNLGIGLAAHRAAGSLQLAA